MRVRVLATAPARHVVSINPRYPLYYTLCGLSVRSTYPFTLRGCTQTQFLASAIRAHSAESLWIGLKRKGDGFSWEGHG